MLVTNSIDYLRYLDKNKYRNKLVRKRLPYFGLTDNIPQTWFENDLGFKRYFHVMSFFPFLEYVDNHSYWMSDHSHVKADVLYVDLPIE